jgi:hypothetical protein
MAAPVCSIPVGELTAVRRLEMARIVGRYYRGPESGLEDELRFGDRVYCAHDPAGCIGAFLIVNLDHHRAVLGERVHRFTYLGLGCAHGLPMVPVFRQAKSDAAAPLSSSEIGVLHLTTRTPFAFRGLQKAFGGNVYPAAAAADQPAELAAIARYLKTHVHRHRERSQGEDPFVLRELKKGRFSAAEVARIRAFAGPNPLPRFGVDCEGADEVIAFHRFTA